MSNIVPQPQITFENNKIYIDSPVDVKYTLDGLDPVFYGVIYTSPISISHTTTIKAISVNSLREISNLVAGTFTPENDINSGNSDSAWKGPVTYTYTYLMNSSGGGGGSSSTITYNISFVDYVTKTELSNCGYLTEVPSEYITETELSNCGYITAADIPVVDLSSYVTYSFLSSQSYLTSIPSEYITQDELSANSYLTQHQDLSSYVTKTELSGMSYATTSQIPVIDESLIPKEDATYNLGGVGYIYRYAYIQTLIGLGTGFSLMLGTEPKYDFYGSSFRPRTDSNINLGGDQYKWANTYTANLYASDIILAYSYNSIDNTSNTRITFKINQNNRFKMTNVEFAPVINNGVNLGTSSEKFSKTYTSTLYADNAYISNMYSAGLYDSTNSANSIKFSNNAIRLAYNEIGFYLDASGLRPGTNGNKLLGTSSNKWGITYTTTLYADTISYISDKSKLMMNDRNIDFYANNKKMINLSDYNGFVPIQTNVNLGNSSNKWGSTYTSDLYADTIHNFIWTGTSAEYALLDNYTSYQIYLIKES